jgi:hypothetical protein
MCQYMVFIVKSLYLYGVFAGFRRLQMHLVFYLLNLITITLPLISGFINMAVNI